MGTYADAHRALVNFVAVIAPALAQFERAKTILADAKDAEVYLASVPGQIDALKKDAEFAESAVRSAIARRDAIEQEVATLRSQRISETSAECRGMIDKAKADIAAQRDAASADRIKAAQQLAEVNAQIKKASDDLAEKRKALAHLETALTAAKSEARKFAALA